MLAQFPSRDVDEPLRREHLDVGLGDLRVEMSEVRVELAALEARMADRFRAQTTWMVALVVAGTTITSAVSALLR